MGVELPTAQEQHLLFLEFNDKSVGDNLFFPNEYSNFIEKMLEMLSAAEFKYWSDVVTIIFELLRGFIKK